MAEDLGRARHLLGRQRQRRFEGRYVGDLSVNDVEKSHKNLRKAVEDAALTYKKYMAGEEIAQPPSNFQKAGNVVTNLFNRRAGA